MRHCIPTARLASVAVLAVLAGLIAGCSSFAEHAPGPGLHPDRIDPVLAGLETSAREFEARAQEAGQRAAESVADSIADAAESARVAITRPIAEAQAQGLTQAETAASVITAATAEASRQGWLGDHGELIAFGVAGILGALGIGKYREDVTKARYQPPPGTPLGTPPGATPIATTTPAA